MIYHHAMKCSSKFTMQKLLINFSHRTYPKYNSTMILEVNDYLPPKNFIRTVFIFNFCLNSAIQQINIHITSTGHDREFGDSLRIGSNITRLLWNEVSKRTSNHNFRFNAPRWLPSNSTRPLAFLMLGQWNHCRTILKSALPCIMIKMPTLFGSPFNGVPFWALGQWVVKRALYMMKMNENK